MYLHNLTHSFCFDTVTVSVWSDNNNHHRGIAGIFQAAAYYLRKGDTQRMSVGQDKRKMGNKKQRTKPEIMPRDEEDQTDEVAQNDMNGDGITLEWRPEEWSKCSQTCGNGGKKVQYTVGTLSSSIQVTGSLLERNGISPQILLFQPGL